MKTSSVVTEVGAIITKILQKLCHTQNFPLIHIYDGYGYVIYTSL